jgi:hypothetical protein
MSNLPPKPAPQPAFFEHPVIDNLLAVTLELGAELWVQKERMRVLEAMLAESGVITREAFERHRDSLEESARVQAERDAFVKRLYGILTEPRVKATPKD